MLLLRRDCEEILNKAGLGELHVQRNNTQKCLSIVGQCGQEIVTIYGIALNSSLKDKEREYAVTLFDRFVSKNGKEIKAAIAAKKAFITLKPFEGNETWIKYYTNEIMHRETGYTFSLEKIEKLKGFITDKFLKEAKTILTDMKAYADAKELVDKKFSEIAKCTI